MVLGVAVIILVSTLISFCKYHRVVLSGRKTHSKLSGTNNVLEVTRNDSIKLSVNQAYGGVQSSATATQHVQDVEYECVHNVLVGNTSQYEDGDVNSSESTAHV